MAWGLGLDHWLSSERIRSGLPISRCSGLCKSRVFSCIPANEENPVEDDILKIISNSEAHSFSPKFPKTTFLYPLHPTSLNTSGLVTAVFYSSTKAPVDKKHGNQSKLKYSDKSQMWKRMSRHKNEYRNEWNYTNIRLASQLAIQLIPFSLGAS